MRLLASAGFFATLLCWSILAAPVGWGLFVAQKLTGLSRTRSWARSVNWLYGRVSIWLVRPFLSVRITNPDAAKNLGPCIMTANHQSFLDLYLLGAQGCTQVCPVAKGWPFKLLFPFAPAMLAAGYINAEDSDYEDIAAQCRERLNEKAALVFYPEGRRSRDGHLGPFHSGAFRLALEHSLPIVPMVIRNSGNAVSPGSFLLRSRSIDMKILEPVMPEEYVRFRSCRFPHRELLNHVRKIYLEELKEKNNEAR